MWMMCNGWAGSDGGLEVTPPTFSFEPLPTSQPTTPVLQLDCLLAFRNIVTVRCRVASPLHARPFSFSVDQSWFLRCLTVGQCWLVTEWLEATDTLTLCSLFFCYYLPPPFLCAFFTAELCNHVCHIYCSYIKPCVMSWRYFHKIFINLHMKWEFTETWEGGFCCHFCVQKCVYLSM